MPPNRFSSLRRAATLRLEITSEKASVKLQSKTGHILPGSTLRTLILEVKLFSPKGIERQTEQIPISDKEQNRLLPSEERTYIFDTLPSATGDTITVPVAVPIDTQNT